MEYPNLVTVDSEDGTIKLAEDFSLQLKEGDAIILNGNLGAGKTFFIKYTLKSLGINNVSSPTFAIVNEYSGSKKIYHFDFYRINKIEELYDVGFNDYLNDQDALFFIEWGDLFEEVLPQKRIEINIMIKDDFSREFYFEKHS